MQREDREPRIEPRIAEGGFWPTVSDGLLGAYWRRPHAYLDAGVRAAMSVFSRIGSPESGLARLRADLESDEWQRRHGHVLARTEIDLGDRLVVA
jgi:hypothetical protein